MIILYHEVLELDKHIIYDPHYIIFHNGIEEVFKQLVINIYFELYQSNFLQNKIYINLNQNQNEIHQDMKDIFHQLQEVFQLDIIDISWY